MKYVLIELDSENPANILKETIFDNVENAYKYFVILAESGNPTLIVSETLQVTKDENLLYTKDGYIIPTFETFKEFFKDTDQ